MFTSHGQTDRPRKDSLEVKVSPLDELSLSREISGMDDFRTSCSMPLSSGANSSHLSRSDTLDSWTGAASLSVLSAVRSSFSGKTSQNSNGEQFKESSAPASSSEGKAAFACDELALNWSANAEDEVHLWMETDSIRHQCYNCGEARGSSSKGNCRKCVACKIVAHSVCSEELPSMGLGCRQTFRTNQDETNASTSNEEFVTRHHWINQKKPSGKCNGCGKNFQGKFAFAAAVGTKEFVAVGCSWCKQLYHNNCFQFQYISETCQFGDLRSMIVPPSWVVQQPGGEGEDSKREKIPLHRCKSHAKLSVKELSHFAIQPQKAAHKRPLLVFVNPKSGGNQGAKLLFQFLWLLNPRQVFNLLDGGPKFALQLYSKVPRLRILVAGGDGTVGWILSAIDELKIRPCPPVAVLPIGTGNDLARTLNWGGGYTDEPLEKILYQVDEASVVHLDRWDLVSTPLPTCPDDKDELNVSEKPPLTVINNYFSIGADALVALEFHESREANPERFNSRFFNKMFYAGAGGKEMLERKLRDLSKHIKVVADGIDITQKIRDAKITALVFINITRYSAGTQPWGVPPSGDDFKPLAHDDGFFEVIGFTTMMIAALQMGGHGLRLAQCRRAEITTSRALPVQVDGEPCRLQPSKLVISLRNQVCMLQRFKRKMSSIHAPVVELFQHLQTGDDSSSGHGHEGRHPRLALQHSMNKGRMRSRSANNTPATSPLVSPHGHGSVSSPLEEELACPVTMMSSSCGEVGVLGCKASDSLDHGPLFEQPRSVSPTSLHLSSSDSSEHFNCNVSVSSSADAM